jgi:hypothetical protein
VKHPKLWPSNDKENIFENMGWHKGYPCFEFFSDEPKQNGFANFGLISKMHSHNSQLFVNTINVDLASALSVNQHFVVSHGRNHQLLGEFPVVPGH